MADVFVIWAKNEDNKINGFVLDREMKGITTPKIDGKLSLRASPTGMINLDDVVVPKENKLNIEGMKGPFSCLNNARLGIAFGVGSINADLLDMKKLFILVKVYAGVTFWEKNDECSICGAGFADGTLRHPWI